MKVASGKNDSDWDEYYFPVIKIILSKLQEMHTKSSNTGPGIDYSDDKIFPGKTATKEEANVEVEVAKMKDPTNGKYLLHHAAEAGLHYHGLDRIIDAYPEATYKQEMTNNLVSFMIAAVCCEKEVPPSCCFDLLRLKPDVLEEVCKSKTKGAVFVTSSGKSVSDGRDNQQVSVKQQRLA